MLSLGNPIHSVNQTSEVWLVELMHTLTHTQINTHTHSFSPMHAYARTHANEGINFNRKEKCTCPRGDTMAVKRFVLLVSAARKEHVGEIHRPSQRRALSQPSASTAVPLLGGGDDTVLLSVLSYLCSLINGRAWRKGTRQPTLT